MSKLYDCAACPAICCTVYESVSIDDRDARRLASRLGMTAAVFLPLFARRGPAGETVLKRKADPASGNGSACVFLDAAARKCTVYEARPDVCRDFPLRGAQAKGAEGRCAYFDLLTYVRRESGDESRVPLVQIKRLVA